MSRVLPAKAILEISLTAGPRVSWQGSRSAPRIAPMSCSGSEKRARKAGGAVTAGGTLPERSLRSKSDLQAAAQIGYGLSVPEIDIGVRLPTLTLS